MRYLLPLIITFLLFTLANALTPTHPTLGVIVLTLGLSAAAYTIAMVLIVRAPLGYQDETGFHKGTPPSNK